MNHEVASQWKKYSASEKKTYLRQHVFKEPEALKRVLEGYSAEELEEFNPREDLQYLLTKISQQIEHIGFNWKDTYLVVDSYTVAREIISFFKQWVENNKGWEVIVAADSRNREKIVQRVIHGIALAFIEANKLDISCEPDEGRGPADFKVSMGSDKTIIEVKLSSNAQYLHGYEVQVAEYGKAEKARNLIYVLIDLGNPRKIKAVKELHDKQYNDGQNPPTLIIIDSTMKKSASKM